MNFKSFIAGLLVGIGIISLIAGFCYNYVYFSIPSGHYDSPVITFYLAEDDPNFSEYQILNGSDFWLKLSADTESKVNKQLKKSGSYREIRIHCNGSAQAYTIFYSYTGHMSLKELGESNYVRELIIKEVRDKYHMQLSKALPDINFNQRQ